MSKLWKYTMAEYYKTLLLLASLSPHCFLLSQAWKSCILSVMEGRECTWLALLVTTLLWWWGSGSWGSSLCILLLTMTFFRPCFYSKRFWNHEVWKRDWAHAPTFEAHRTQPVSSNEGSLGACANCHREKLLHRIKLTVPTIMIWESIQWEIRETY